MKKAATAVTDSVLLRLVTSDSNIPDRARKSLRFHASEAFGIKPCCAFTEHTLEYRTDSSPTLTLINKETARLSYVSSCCVRFFAHCIAR